jgi:hypothetical protein
LVVLLHHAEAKTRLGRRPLRRVNYFCRRIASPEMLP